MRSLRLLRTTTFRLTLIYLALFLASVLAVLGLVYWYTVNYVDRQTDETILAQITGLSDQYRQRGLAGLIQAVNDRVAVPRTSTIYLVATPAYAPIAGNLTSWPDATPTPDGIINFNIDEVGAAGDGPYLARAKTYTLSGGYHLLVGRDLRERQAFQRQLVFALAWALVLTVGLGMLGGVWMSRSLMRRVEAINRTTAKIMTGFLNERVALRGSDDELDQLAGNLNAMLDQIEALMTGMRQVTESVAHDLRTPLTRLRTRLEVALLEPARPDLFRAAIQEAIAEADRLLGIFSALLSIAEAEAGARAGNFRPVSLAELARTVADLYEPVAEERGLGLATEIAGEPTVLGNDQLLSQAVANLLDNAIKYTPAAGRILLSVASATGTAGPSLTVTDTGPGIPADQREKVLQRFVRLESSRSSPGNGLGLSLVDAVARLHGGRVVLDDNHPGLRITLVFPSSQPRPALAEAA